MNGGIDMKRKKLGFVLASLTRLYYKCLNLKLMSVGIPYGQPPVLDYLTRNDGCIQNAIAKALHLEPATVTSVLTTMERDGLIERRACGDDKRISKVYITEKGLEAKIVARDVMIDFSETVLADFTDEEIDILVNLCSKMRLVVADLYDMRKKFKK